MLSAAHGWTRMWTRIYTIGLPADARGARRDEIASDVWEQAHAEALSNRAGASIFARSLAGIPADVSWRLEQSAAPRQIVHAVTLVAESSTRWVVRRGLPGLPTTVAAGLSLLGLLLLLTLQAGDSATQADRAVGGVVLLLNGAFMLGGMQVLSDQPRVGATMVIVPTLFMALILWSTLVAPLVAVAIVLSVLARARRTLRTRREAIREQSGAP